MEREGGGKGEGGRECGKWQPTAQEWTLFKLFQHGGNSGDIIILFGFFSFPFSSVELHGRVRPSCEFGINPTKAVMLEPITRQGEKRKRTRCFCHWLEAKPGKDGVLRWMEASFRCLSFQLMCHWEGDSWYKKTVCNASAVEQ